MQFIKLSIIFFAFTVPLFGNAKMAANQELDLLCKPHGISDGGFVVKGRVTADYTLRLEIDRVNGWLGDQSIFEGEATLRTELVDGKCQLYLQDKVENPGTVIALRSDQPDLLQRVNGKDIVPVMSEISCQVSSKFKNIVPICR